MTDWRNINDIVRSSIKSLTNIVRNQGIAIKELNKAINSKIDKNDIQNELNSKCDKIEVNKKFSELKNLINTKSSNDQINELLKDKISKNEVLFYLSNKASTDDINNILEEKIGIREFEEILNQINLLKNEKIDVNLFNSEIKEIKEILENKTNSMDVINALETKVDKDELNTELKNFADRNESNNLLKKKADKIESERIYELLNEKMSNKELKKFDKIEEILKEKADNKDFNLIKDAFQDMKTQFTQRIDDIDNDLDRLIENIKSQFKSMSGDMKILEKNISENSNTERIHKILKNKANINDIEENFNSLKNNIFQSMNSFMNEVESNQKIFEEKIMSNLDKILKENKYIMENMNIQGSTIKDLFNNKNNYENKINELNISEISKNISDYKLEIKKDMENILNILTNKLDINALNKEISNIKTETENKIKSLNENQDNLILEINSKIREMYEDLSKELENKMTLNDAKLLLGNKANNKEINGEDNTFVSHNLNEIKKQLKQKLDINIFNKVINQFNINFDNIKKDIISTTNIEEINKLLETKISNDQFNKFLKEINKKLNEKVNTIDFTASIDNQAIINDTLCNENTIGRWLWNSGNNQNNYIIPWESQSVNTSPDNFIWEKDKTFILVNEEGLYELNLGFYSDKRPSIQVLVNGEIIINSQNNNNTLNKKIIGKNGDINSIIGISIIEFIMLKKQSKISVLFYGGKGHGFIGLKKI